QFPVELTIVPLTEGGHQFFCAFVRDITEMKKAATELKQSNERFKMITSTTNDAVWEWDFETGQMWGNETHQQLYGLTLADPVPVEKQWQERLHPDDRGIMIKKQAEALASDTNVFITEYRFNTEEEGYKNIYDRCYIVRDKEGKAVRILGSMMDITERKKTEELVKESEARYKALVENAPEALVVFDADHGKFVSVSETAIKLFKMSREELLKIGPVEVSPEYQPDGRLSVESAMEKIRETVAGGKPSFEWTHRDKEGNPIPCEVWLVRLPSETQTLIRGSIVDITVRKKAELKLKESEEKYRSVIEQATDFIMITDQQGNFIDTNSSFNKTFGYTKEEILQLNISKVIDPEQLKIRPVRFDLLVKGETILNERRMLTKTGAGIDVEANVKMLPDGRILAIARDIRDRKKAEEQLSNERNLLRALIDHLPDYIYVKDTSLNFLISNRAFVKLVGAASEEENYRKNSIDLFGEEIGQINMKEDKKIIETGEIIIDRDEPIVTREGKERWLLTTKVPLKDQEEKVTGILGISKDITERKEAERIIKESEEKYRTIIEQAPDGIFISDKNTFFVDVNRSGCSMLGYTKEELLKMRFTELISPDSLKNNPLRMDELNSGQIVLSERKVIRKDGSEISVEINAKLRPDGFYQSFIRDVTDRNKAEEALKASEERYRTLVEQAVDAIALYNISGKILDVNTGSVKLLGYSKEELMKMNLADILTKEEIQTKPVQYDVLQKGVSTIRQRMMRKKNGSVIQTEVRSQQLPDGRFLSVIRDLTERINAQEQIQREKELSDSVINSLPGLFYLIDESGKYIRWNKLKEEISGYTAKEISQMNSLDFFEGEEKKLVRQRIKEGIANGVTDIEAHLVTKKGKRILFYFAGIAIDYEGKKCLMGTGIDISDRKKAEQELEESYEAIRKLTEHLQNIREEERAHIAREIHDELGQQLTVLKMDISWINKKIPIQDESVKARMKELLVMLDETVKSVRRISSELRPSLLDDLGLIAAMEWQLTEFEKRFEIKTHFKSDDAEIKLPESVKTALFRILQESLTNVARHSEAKKVTVSLNRKKNNSIVLSVVDNGVGFDKQNVIGKKTLGILGMQERTSMIGGTYEISGKPGKGTRVVVTIPLVEGN
ncbi:MAG TPA: PAS domain S-box protein, partial [Chitinophagaceae bacterium]|nr:PAS domain S-box protein [Chitinophagaceae bacterium]